MRELKIRAFNNNEMLYPNGIFINGDRIRLLFRDKKRKEIEYTSIPYNKKEPTYIMQYTGLKDKNGKEIYEGDIIRVEREHDFTYEIIGTVIYMPSRGYCLRVSRYWDVDQDIAIKSSLRYGHITQCYSKIIGNIYENPEVLQ